MDMINRRKRITTIVASLLLLTGLFLGSCDKYSFEPPQADPNKEVSFASDIQPIFNSNCVGCHSGSVNPNLSEGEAYDELISGDYIADDPENNAEESLIYSKLLEPSHRANASTFEKSLILVWIQQGAKDN